MVLKIMTAAVVVHVLLDCLRDHGVTPEEIEKKTGIEPSRVGDPELQTPLRSVLMLWELAVKVTGDPALAIHLRRTYGRNLTHFSNYICLNSVNGLESLENFIRYARLICEAHQFELKKDSEFVTINYLNTSLANQNIWMPEYNLSSLIYFGRRLIHKSFNPEEVRFQHRCPTKIKVYEDFFGSPVLFEQNENSVTLKKQPLLKPFTSSDPHLLAVLKKQADLDLKCLSDGRQITTRVQQNIIKHLPTGNLNFDSIADELKISRSSLYRSLKEEGTSFKTLLINIRKSLTETYLKQGLNASQIAYLVGYSDISSFQHAFKLWFGESLGKYRAKIVY